MYKTFVILTAVTIGLGLTAIEFMYFVAYAIYYLQLSALGVDFF